MKFVVFYLQFINSLEGLGMFFSSAALIRRFRRYAATDVEYREPAVDRCQIDPHPEVSCSASRSSNSINSDQEQTSHTRIFEQSHF